MKFLNLLLVAAIVLTAFGIASAQSPAITAYSVTGVQVSAATDLGVTAFTATVSIVKVPKTTGVVNGDAITINTVNCTHVPAKGGENGIIVVNGAATTLLFSSGATCGVKSVTTK